MADMIRTLANDYPVMMLVLTLVVYVICLGIYQLSKRNMLLMPITTGIVAIVAILVTFDIDYTAYFESVQIIHFLLGTATVALAVPLRNNFHLIVEHAFPLSVSLIVMGIFTPVLAVASAWVFGADKAVLLSLAPKSISTPFAIGVAEAIGAYPSLVAVIVIVTGIVVALVSSIVFKVFAIHNPIAQGFSLGLVGHGVGTAAAFELSFKAGAFSALAMGLMGLSTSILLPYLIVWLF